MKLTKLDDDSKIGHGPMSGGNKNEVISIQAPSGFGKEIWEELADHGFPQTRWELDFTSWWKASS